VTHSGENWTLHVGDCRDWLASLPDASVDAVVTDPPYELGFMGKRWDASGIAFQVGVWSDVFRVLKPGAHLLAFSGTRTCHRMVCAIEDAGFEIRDQIDWIFGSGFPKSLDVSKAIDAAAGAVREVVGPGTRHGGGIRGNGTSYEVDPRVPPATVPATVWNGWGTALKPAHEPVCVARKPLIGTVAANVLEHGTGAINVDGCRVGATRPKTLPNLSAWRRLEGRVDLPEARGDLDINKGRWPSNIILTHAPDCGDECAPDCPVAEMGRQSGELGVSVGGSRGRAGMFGIGPVDAPQGFGDTGTAARFFPVFRYEAKAATSERERGCYDLPRMTAAECVDREPDSDGMNSPRAGAGSTSQGRANGHPTVKPVDLMRWLVRLVTPPGGLVIDPFTGSGTTGVACMREGGGIRFAGCELSPEYARIAAARIRDAAGQLDLFA
jgi:site-specific DNA-methyltransferase (adenine-specific)